MEMEWVKSKGESINLTCLVGIILYASRES
jgi:hypothetical protein